MNYKIEDMRKKEERIKLFVNVSVVFLDIYIGA